ncbi:MULTISPECIES: dienelactone hydrolase family protein [Streptomyces]|uniref:Dienelactone hydrolase family protein n=1 Tax=Streptomyces sudanensis TaxID=436397 RepID=A0ABY4THP9_9ACTN|nr:MULTISPECIES: dienelactone hydrolase family protein [Streptomyces]URN17303.1 dienelactone hydrolase family protein [Streptomyces sudanensis]
MRQFPLPRPRATHRTAGRVLTAVALLAGLGPAPSAYAADNPYERGPAPTEASIEAERGPYAVSQTTVPRDSVTGFGGGTVYYPTTTGDGTFGAVSVCPGYMGTQSSIAWLGPRLASQGFAVFVIDTITPQDQPDSRGRQLLAALDHLTRDSSLRTRVDSTRLGVMGHSMGGGGSLAAAKSRPSLQAAVPLMPWHQDKTWPELRTPTMIFGAENDNIAPVASHAEPFYGSLPSSLDRAYLEMNNATHNAPLSSNTTIAKYSTAWLKRFIDDDTRYEQFLCPLPQPSATIEEYRGNCPHTS